MLANRQPLYVVCYYVEHSVKPGTRWLKQTQSRTLVTVVEGLSASGAFRRLGSPLNMSDSVSVRQ